jgi:adenosine deaminase
LNEHSSQGAALQFPIFQKYIYKLVNNVEAVKFATNSVLEDFANDGVIYLELRTIPRDCKETNMRKEDYIEAIFDAIAEFERSKLGQKTGLKTKLMLSIDRADTYAVAEQTVDLALLYKSRGVVGLDLAGNPHVCLVQISRS